MVCSSCASIRMDKLKRKTVSKHLFTVADPMILNDQITSCCSHQAANPSLTSQTAGLVIPTSSKTRYDCTLPFVWTDVVPKYLGLGKQETMSLKNRQVNFINYVFSSFQRIISGIFGVSLFFAPPSFPVSSPDAEKAPRPQSGCPGPRRRPSH